MRTFFLSILSLFVFTICLLSCSSNKNDEVKINYKDTISIAITPTLDCLPLIVAKETGIADSLQHCIILQYHNSKADCDTALAGGSVHAMFTDYVRAENLQSNWTRLFRDKRGKKVKMESLTILPEENLRLFFYTNYKARLNEAKQLTDKMIAVDRKSVENDMAQYVLDSVKLSNEKAFLVNILSYNVRRDMLTNNIMDAVVFPEPYASIAKKAGHKSVFASSKLNGKVLGRMVATKDIKIIKQLYNLGCDSLNKKGLHAYDSLLVKKIKVPNTVVSTVPNYRFITIK